MARLHADLIRRSPQYLSAIKERVLDLRGNKIAVIENIGATEDQFDIIDMSDNEIVKLENFPFMNCLGTLLINNNRITRINPNLGEFLPKMHTLVLTNNRLTSLAEIDPLASLPKLQVLSLLDNTVTKQPDYRSYVIHKLKHLHLLDLQKVKQQERTEAVKKFHSKEAEEATEKVTAKAHTPAVVDAQGTTKEQGLKVVALTPTQITAFKAAIVNSQMLEEVTRLEKALSTGQVPVEFALPKLVTNMAEVSEEAEAEKMETDGQDQEDGADGQKQTDESTSIEEEMLGVGLESTSTEICHIQSYIYKNFQRADFNFIFSWRKRPFRGLHIIPPPRRQEPGDCTYHATLGIMECGFKAKYALRGRRKNREFNVRLSHDHLKKLVLDFMESEEGKGFRLRDKLRVCLMVAMRYGVVSETDFKDGCPPGAVRYKIRYYRELGDDEKEGIPDMLDKAKMILTSFRVTPRYRSLLPHEIYRYLPAEDVVYQESISSSGSDDKKPMHESHCVVLTNHGLAYPALEEVATEAEVSKSERYFEYLNSYSAGFGVDGSGYIYSDSIHKCYKVVV